MQKATNIVWHGGHVEALERREFWQRAEDRNRATAKVYDTLGLAEYEAMEGFMRWRG